MKTDKLYQLTKKDIPELVKLLAECFQEDPLFCHLIPDKEIRKRVTPEILECDIEEEFKNCNIFADSKELNGIIIVSDESEPYNPIKYYWNELLFALKTDAYLIKEDKSLRTFWNFIKGSEYLDSRWTCELERVKRLHIIYFAVRPSKRGTGIADRLMYPILDYVDTHHLETSLETHKEQNVGLYQHYGFQIYKVIDKHTDLKQYCMVRPAVLSDMEVHPSFKNILNETGHAS
ncbi:MAG: GCN5-related N-acetyltransferase [Herbinix sp.]|nr:GCN5-related N-acetyltransferase [Herbinix sp.]